MLVVLNYRSSNVFCVLGKPQKFFSNGRAIKTGEGGKGPAIKAKSLFFSRRLKFRQLKIIVFYLMV